MVFSWLQNLKRGLITGSVRSRSVQVRRGVRVVAQQAAPATIESLESRLMLTNVTPSIAIVGTTFLVNQGASANFTGIAFSDSDSGGNSERVTLSVAHGTLTVNTGVVGGITPAQIISGNGTASVIIEAPLTALNTTLNATFPSAYLTYTSSPTFSGSETLTVKIDDLGNTGNTGGAHLTSTKTKAITVNPVTQAPIGTAKTVASLEGGSYTFTAADFGYTDPYNTPANNFVNVKITTVTPGAGTLKNNNVTVTAGTVVTVADINAGKLVFTPSALTYGSNYANFTFQVQSDGDTTFSGVNLDPNPKLMTIDVTQVNQAPTITAPSTASTNSGTPVVIGGISFADVDSNSQNETYTFSVTNGVLTLSTVVAGGISAGQITNNETGSITVVATLAQINATLADAAGLTYTPTASYFGPATLSLGINDGGNTGVGGAKTANASVAISVIYVNQAPSIIAPPTASVLENNPLIVTGVQFADVDSNGQPESVTLSVSHGTLTLSTIVSGGLNAGQITGNGTSSLTISGTLAQINATLADANGLTYTPTTLYVGNDSLLLGINDNGNTGTGGAQSASTSISITVNLLAPVLADIEGATLIYPGIGAVTVTSALTVTEENSQAITGATVQISAGYQSSLDTLLFTNTATITGSWNGATGTLTLSGSDTQANYQAALRSIQLQTTGANSTPRTVSFTVTDGFESSNTVSRVVDGLPHALSITPVASPITGTTATFNVVFSESVTGVSPAAFTLSGDGVTGGSIAVSGSGASYTVTVTGLLGSGTLGLNLTNGASILDVGGNAVAASFTGARLTKFVTGQGVVLSGGTLNVVGTDGSDVITVAEDTTLRVSLNGINYTFDPNLVTTINLNAGKNGNDQITVSSLKPGTTLTAYASSGACTIDCSAISSPVTIYGGTGNSTLIGGSGNDTLYGNKTGGSTLNGNGGSDYLFSYLGNNTLNGGLGNDTYVIGSRTTLGGSDTDTFTDAGGFDTLNFFQFTRGLTFNLGVSGVQTADAGTGYKVNIPVGTFEAVTLGSGNNVVTGNSSLGTTITGGAGNDVLTGGTGNDTLIGNGGNDTLSGGLGRNTLNGGLDNDVYFVASRSALGGSDSDTFVDAGGVDYLKFNSFTRGLTFNMGTLGLQVADVGTGYKVSIAVDAFETVDLGSGDNVVTGNPMLGTRLNGGSGNDTLTGGTGNDYLAAGSGNNTLTGNAGDDTLLGGVGNDILIGNAGNDTLYSGLGSNTLDGGADDDTYGLGARTAPGGSDTDTFLDASGKDTLLFNAFTSGLTLNLGISGLQTADAGTGYQVDIPVDVFETINVGSGDDIVTGNPTLATSIVGGAGNDILIGGSGKDFLAGGTGNDILISGLAWNQLYGGNDDDILISGTFSLAANITALTQIRDEWTSAGSYQSRVDHLRGTTGGGLNGAFLIDSSTVTLSTSTGILNGEAGNDWFWANNVVTKDLNGALPELNG